MKKRSWLFILLMASFLSASYGPKQTPWQGEIDYEDGVKIIKNPQEPLYGETEFELEEDLCISNETFEGYMFYRIRGMAVDSENNLFVVDMTSYRVLGFDKNGKPIQTIGREGQGPGEFEMPIGLAVDNSTGNIFVGDRFRAIEVFSKNGDLEKTITSKLFIMDFFPLKAGTFFILVRNTSDED